MVDNTIVGTIYLSIDNESLKYIEDYHVIGAHRVAATVAILLIPLTLVSNGVVLWSLVLCPNLYPGGRYLLISLAVTNILIAVFSLPTFAMRYVPSVRSFFLTNRLTCMLMLTSLGLPGSGTLYTYFLIALDRFIAIQWPMKYYVVLHEIKSANLVDFIWTYIICVCTFIISIWGAYEPTLDPRLVPCRYNATLSSDIISHISSFIFLILIGIAIVFNSLLTYKTASEVRYFDTGKSNISRHKTRQLDYTLASTKVTNILLILFFLLWSPSALAIPLMQSHSLSPQQVEIYRVTTQLLRLTNAFFHAPVHAFARKQIRHLFFMMMTTAPWHWANEMINLHRRTCFSLEGHVRFSITVQTYDIMPASCSPKYSASTL